MSFLNNLKGAPMPPIKNVLKDAWQQAKQSIPDRQKQQQYEDPSATSEYGGSSQISSHSSHRQPHNVHFADGIDESGQKPTELNPLNPFRNGLSYDEQHVQPSSYQFEETGFNQGDYNYQQGGFPAR